MSWLRITGVKRTLLNLQINMLNKYIIVLKQPQLSLFIRKTGKVRIINYKNDNFIVPFVNDILSTDLSGTTGVLTKTNDEALQITGLLLKKNIPAKLIQSNDGFNLFNLFEIRSFIEDLNLDESTPTISIGGLE